MGNPNAMVPVKFQRERAEQLLQAIKAGTPIEPPDAKDWNALDMIVVAGALYFAAMTHTRPPEYTDDEDIERHPRDLLAAVEFASVLVGMVEDGEYDGHAESEAQAAVRVEGAPLRNLVACLAGFKGG
jgi:hypothetical protein